MRRVLFVFMIIALFAVPLFAQEAAVEEEDGSASLGMYYTVGEFNMIGLHFQKWFGNHGLMISAGITDGNMSAIVEYEYCIYKARFTDTLNSKLYLWLMGGPHFVNEHVWSEPEHDNFYVNGVTALGVGMEFVWWKHLSVPVQFGYVITYPHNVSCSFCFASGIRYRF